MHRRLDIAVSDEAASTVIHLRGPGSARMCDVGCVFDKLGVDVISCSSMPAPNSCDMTLVVVDRYQNQPLDDALKQSVVEGLQHVFSANGQRSQHSSPSKGTGKLQPEETACSDSSRQAPGPGTDDLLPQAVPLHAIHAGSRSTSMEACRADSASESIPVSKSSSPQQTSNDECVLEPQLVHPPAAGPQADAAAQVNPVAGASNCQQEQQEQQQPHSVRFNPTCSVCTVPADASPSLQRTGSGRPPKPALKIHIPSDSDSSSRWQCDNSEASSSRKSDGPQSTAAGCSNTSRGGHRAKQQQQQQLSGNELELAKRLLDLGMTRQDNTAIGEDFSDDEGDTCDTAPTFGARSAGSSSSTGGPPQLVDCNWQQVRGPSPLTQAKSCGNLLQVAGKQQVACVQRASDSGVGSSTLGDGQLDCFGTSRTSLDTGLEQQGDSSRSLASIDQDQDQQGSGRRMPTLSPAPGATGAAAAAAVAGSSSAGGRKRRPPPRRPSRIILSPVGVDGVADPTGQPKLFVSIPKSAGDDRRASKRTGGSSGTQSCTATPRVPFTPASGIAVQVPASASPRGGHSLKQLSSSLVGRKPAGPMSPRAAAAAAAAATANMPYNVAVAAAQLLSSNSSSNTREAAAAVVAAAAEKGDSSTPLPSPLHSAALLRFSDDSLTCSSPRVPRTSPCFQQPPPTPVHPAVAAAAAAAITAAADAVVHSQAADQSADQSMSDDVDDDELLQLLPACMSPQRTTLQRMGSHEVPGLPASSAAEAAAAAAAAVAAPIPEGTETEDAEGAQGSDAGSSSEEWWCGELTGLCVRDIMTGPVKAVAADADMVAAKQLMMQHNLPGMLVDRGLGQQPGFLTRADFFKASMMRRKGSRKRPQKQCVRDFMGPLLVVDADMAIEVCAQALQEADLRYAVVRGEPPAGALEGGGDSTAEQPTDEMAGYVGLVSNTAIYCCLGLYPDDAAGGQEELLEDGLLGLPTVLRLHSGLDSSFESSGGGTETPLSSRSRVATPLLDSSARDGGGDMHLEQQDSGRQSEQQSRQTNLVKQADMVVLREGLGGSSTASSMCSVRSGAAAVADDNHRTGPADASDDGGTNRSGDGTLVGAGSGGSTGAARDGSAAAAGGQEPDVLTRYKHAAALWEVDLDDLEMLRRIGEGSFGEVMLATYRGTKVAVKRLRVLDLDDTPAPNEQYALTDGSNSSGNGRSEGRRGVGASQAAFRQFFEREIAILASIRHPNVVNFIGACHKPGQRCLVTEYCARGSLDQVLHKSGTALDLSKRIEFAMDIARGMACLHAQRPIIIHRDLKTANLLVSARYEVKVADFGLSRIKDASHLQVSRAGLEGTIEYCAPEVLRGEPYTERCDVYSFGVVLWELLLRQRPYSDAEVPVFLLMVNIGNGTLALPDVPPEAATPGLVELVNRCLSFSAADRPEFREVLALLETEYKALRARQPPRQQQQQQLQQAQQHQQVQAAAAAVLRCDSASSLAVNQQSPCVAAESPDPGGTPHAQSPAGTLGATGNVLPALTAGTAFGVSARAWPLQGAAPAAEQEAQQQPWLGSQQQQQQQQRHRLSQHDSLSMLQTASSGGAAAPTFGFHNMQPMAAATPHLGSAAQQPQYQFSQQQQQQQVFSVPLPQLQLQQQQSQPQQVYVASLNSSPHQQQPQPFAVPLMPQMRVMSAIPSGNLGMPAPSMQQQQQLGPQQYQQHQGHPGPGAGPTGGSSVKPPRHKLGSQLSRARSMPAPQSAWELDEDDEVEQHGRGVEDIQEETAPQDLLLFGEDSFGGVSSCSMTAYSPCPSGQLCMLVEPASSTFGSSSAAGMLPYQQPQQQVLVTPGGQQVAVQQVAMQPVLIQQPGGQLQQAYIQQQPYTALQQAPQQQQHQHQQHQQQQQPQQAARILQQRALGTPSPTPAVLGRNSTPLSSSPSPGLNQLAIMAAAGAAAAHARRDGSASGAASPRGHTGSMLHVMGGSHSRSSSHGCSQEMPPLHLLQLSDMHNSRPASPQRGAVLPLVRTERLSSEGGGAAGPGAAGTPVLGTPVYSSSSIAGTGQQHAGLHTQAVVVNAAGAAMVTPLLLQRLDSLHRSGSSGCSPRCLHRSSSPGLQAEHSGQLLGLLVPGYCSGPASPRSHSPAAGGHAHPAPAVAAAVHHLHRPGSSRLAIQGSYELPQAAAAMTAAAGAPAAPTGDSHAVAGAVPAAAGVPAAAAASGGYSEPSHVPPVYGGVVQHGHTSHTYHLQYPQPHPPVMAPGSRRAPSLLRIDSNSRDRAVSPFALASGATAPEDRPYGSASGATAFAGGHVAPAPAGTCSRTLSPFAAASSAGSSLEDVASRGNSNDVVQGAAAGAGGAVPGATGSSSAVPGTCSPFSNSSVATPGRYVSPFAAAASRQDDEDTDAVFDTSAERNSRSASPAPGHGKQGLPPSSNKAAVPVLVPAGMAGSAAAGNVSPPGSSRRLASPFALMQQQERSLSD